MSGGVSVIFSRVGGVLVNSRFIIYIYLIIKISGAIQCRDTYVLGTCPVLGGTVKYPVWLFDVAHWYVLSG